jgi:hypothetical protein
VKLVLAEFIFRNHEKLFTIEAKSSKVLRLVALKQITLKLSRAAIIGSEALAKIETIVFMAVIVGLE